MKFMQKNSDSCHRIKLREADDRGAQYCRFFRENRTKMDFSARAISEQLFVSEHRYRVLQKCGYRGYREFIYQYEEGFAERTEAMAGNTRTVLNTYQELLNKTYNLEDEAQIARVCSYMAKASRVFVSGLGSSGLARQGRMELRFMRIGVDIDTINDPDIIRMRSVFQNERCMIIGISISGENEAVRYLLKEGHKRRARTVLLTAANKDEFGSYCDEVVLLPSLAHLNHGNVISPQFPILVMIDILYSYYVNLDKYEKEMLHDDTLKALRERG